LVSSILPKNELENSIFCPSLLRQKFFVRFLEELKIPKSPFEINWPLMVLHFLEILDHLPRTYTSFSRSLEHFSHSKLEQFRKNIFKYYFFCQKLPAHCTGKHLWLKIGSVNTVAPSISTRTVAWPIQVAFKLSWVSAN
jgi:hypothetical protein